MDLQTVKWLVGGISTAFILILGWNARLERRLSGYESLIAIKDERIAGLQEKINSQNARIDALEAVHKDENITVREALAEQTKLLYSMQADIRILKDRQHGQEERISKVEKNA